MEKEVVQLIAALGLVPHPEGGFYRETFRSPVRVKPSAEDGWPQRKEPAARRNASTAIYFLLPAGTFSAWHKVTSDEVWHHYGGDPVDLHQLDERTGHTEARLGPDVLVAPTSALARERARAVLGRNYVQHQYPNRIGTAQMASTKLEPSMSDEAVTVDYLMENVWIVGDPSECAEKIQQVYEESGGFGSLLTITTDSDDAGWDHESLRLLMEAVAPRVAHLG
jgi:hypothetical protein